MAIDLKNSHPRNQIFHQQGMGGKQGGAGLADEGGGGGGGVGQQS